MFAELPDYDLERQLGSQTDKRLHDTLRHVLIEAENLRTGQWRLAYWSALLSLVCTLGTAFIGTATAILSFTDHPTAQKGLSILMAIFGIVLSLIKGTGMPDMAFEDFNKANQIIDRIRDVTSNSPLDWDEVERIKKDWRTIRDHNISNRGATWANIQNAGIPQNAHVPVEPAPEEKPSAPLETPDHPTGPSGPSDKSTGPTGPSTTATAPPGPSTTPAAPPGPAVKTG